MDIRGDEHTALMLHAVGVAALGGLVSWMRHRGAHKGPHRWWQLVVSVITAGFLGLLSHYVCNYLELDFHLQFFISGMTGYGGGALLDDMTQKFRHLMESGADRLEKSLEMKKE